jgi:hypothetical protein
MSFFENEVKRDSAYTKFNSLIQETDYFLYEMFHNYNRSIKGDYFRIFKNIKMLTLESVNYLFTIIQQILLLYYFFRNKKGNDVSSTIASDDEKFSIYNRNLVISIIKIFYIAVVIIIWVKYFADLSYQQIMMKKY